MKDYYCVECGCELCEICGHDYSFEYKENGITAIEITKD